jgi:hypothetical protein
VSGAPTRLVKRVVSGFGLNGSRVNRVVNGSCRVTRFASPNTQDMATITMRPNPYRLVPQTQVSNPYSRLGYMDRATTFDDVNVKQQVSPHEASDNVGDSQDIPLPNSQEVPQLDSHEIPPPELEDIP